MIIHKCNLSFWWCLLSSAFFTNKLSFCVNKVWHSIKCIFGKILQWMTTFSSFLQKCRTAKKRQYCKKRESAFNVKTPFRAKTLDFKKKRWQSKTNAINIANPFFWKKLNVAKYQHWLQLKSGVIITIFVFY